MQSKTDWLKDWIEKYRKALRDISELDMAIRDIEEAEKLHAESGNAESAQ